jgi:type II secretory pathway pseudopilin PulG
MQQPQATNDEPQDSLLDTGSPADDSVTASEQTGMAAAHLSLQSSASLGGRLEIPETPDVGPDNESTPGLLLDHDKSNSTERFSAQLEAASQQQQQLRTQHEEASHGSSGSRGNMDGAGEALTPKQPVAASGATEAEYSLAGHCESGCQLPAGGTASAGPPRVPSSIVSAASAGGAGGELDNDSREQADISNSDAFSVLDEAPASPATTATAASARPHEAAADHDTEATAAPPEAANPGPEAEQAERCLQTSTESHSRNYVNDVIGGVYAGLHNVFIMLRGKTPPAILQLCLRAY